MTRLPSSVQPTRSGLLLVPMDSGWLADPKWSRLRCLLPDFRDFWSAAGLFWATVAETWRGGGPGASVVEYLPPDHPEAERIRAALASADLLDGEGRLTEATWEKWAGTIAAKRADDAERKRRSRAGHATSRDVTVTGRDSRALPRGRPTTPLPLRDDGDVDAGGVDGEGLVLVGRDLPDAYVRVALLAETLTGRPYVIGDPYSKMGEKVRYLLDRHGEEAVTEAMNQTANDTRVRTQKDPTDRQLIFGTADRLDPVLTVPRSERDCETCLNTGVTAKGSRCPDCHRGRGDR